jgi:FKBP-type peptidyl-prolyl cis-trans isomerase FklB
MTLPTARQHRVIFPLAVLALTGALLAQAQQPPAAKPDAAAASSAPKKAAAPEGEHAAGADAASSQKSAASYSLGVSMGAQLRGNGVPADAVNPQRLAQGVHDALTGKVKLTEADQNNIQALVRTSVEGAAEANHQAAAKFLAENGKKPGIITTASGLQYKVMAAGSGESPKANDEATVNYRGTLLDGTEFDSSYKRGQPATFQVSRVIPGWTEALQLMKPGAKYQLFIPPQLAYDLRSRPPIPPGAMLIFDVELLSFKPAEAPPAAAHPAEPGSAAPK